jgi:uncharacterized protein YoxC
MSEETFRIIVTIGVAMAALSFVAMGAALLMMYKLVQRTQEKVMQLVPGVTEKAKVLMDKTAPILDKSREIMTTSHQIMVDNRPKISMIAAEAAEIGRNVSETVTAVKPRVNKIAAEAAEIARSVKGRVSEVGETVSDVNHRVREKVHRASETVDHTRDAVMRPVRSVGGVFEGLRAAFSTFFGRHNGSEHRHRYSEPGDAVSGPSYVDAGRSRTLIPS